MTVDEDDSDEEVCGFSFDHDEVTEAADGITVWTCRRCGAEGAETSDGTPL